jgi:integrin beta 8
MAAQFGPKISIKGIAGARGAPGLDGLSIITGDGVPSLELGKPGDSYLDLLSGDLYSPKSETSWGNAVRNLTGPQGIAGPIGPSGKAFLSGYQAPADSLGDNGDSYFCQQNASIYGPKQNGTWPQSPTSIVGPPGPGGSQGTIIYPVSDVPDDTMGRDGDFAIDTAHHTYYGPKYGTWGDAVDLVGPQGVQGVVGPQGDPGADGQAYLGMHGAPNATLGKVGDYWLDLDASVIYGPKTADPHSPWPLQGFSFRGATGAEGPVGPAGFMGQNGKSFIIASSDPSTSDGQEGDTWFNKTTGYIYGPKTSGSWDLNNGDLIKGAKGDVGDVGPQGPQGQAGIGFLTGTDAPPDGLGETGQYYYASKSFTIYGPKNANGNSAWGVGHAIIGAKGDKGDTGADSTVPGPQGPQGVGVYLRNSAPNSSFGNDGDGVVTQSGDVYGPKTGGSWGAKIGSLVGPIGPVGPQGPAGNASTVAGPSGLSFLVGSGMPSASYGNDGDSFFDQVARAIYPNKTSGAWSNPAISLVGASGPQGTQGIAGKDGANGTTLRYGSNSPGTSTISNDGDFYIDQTNDRLYGPRTNGTWSSSYIPLIGPTGQKGDAGAAGKDGAAGVQGPAGPTGPAGSQITYGTAEPGITYGNDGDFYIRTDTWNLYYKVTHYVVSTTPDYPNGWQILGTLRGPQGVAGATGATGPQGQTGLTGATGSQGPQGPVGSVGAAGKDGVTIRTGTGAPTTSNPSLQNDGDFYFATDLYTLYGPRSSGAWPSGTSLRGNMGVPGSQGVQGTAGADGKSVLFGSGAPSDTMGVQGQIYIDNVAFAAYTKGASSWGASQTLVGPMGATGLQGPAGAQGTQGAAGSAGPAGVGLVSGTGAPTSTNPGGTITAGSFYIRTDVTPNQLFGPYSASTGWPSSYTAMGGGTFQTTSGPPASSLGSVGDCAFDLTNALFYPPKTSSGWTATPINMVGPTGPAGPSTSYRNIARGSCWAASGAATAGATYSILQTVTQASSTTYGVPFVETMYAAGSLYAVTANAPAGVGASVWTFNILKNGTQVAQLVNFLTLGSAAGSAFKVLPSGLSFAAGDNITMTGVPSTSASNQSFNCALVYTTNS